MDRDGGGDNDGERDAENLNLEKESADGKEKAEGSVLSNKRKSVENLQSSPAIALEPWQSELEANNEALVVRDQLPVVPPLPLLYVSPRKNIKRPKKVVHQEQQGEKEWKLRKMMVERIDP